MTIRTKSDLEASHAGAEAKRRERELNAARFCGRCCGLGAVLQINPLTGATAEVICNHIQPREAL